MRRRCLQRRQRRLAVDAEPCEQLERIQTLIKEQLKARQPGNTARLAETQEIGLDRCVDCIERPFVGCPRRQDQVGVGTGLIDLISLGIEVGRRGRVGVQVVEVGDHIPVLRVRMTCFAGHKSAVWWSFCMISQRWDGPPEPRLPARCLMGEANKPTS